MINQIQATGKQTVVSGNDVVWLSSKHQWSRGAMIWDPVSPAFSIKFVKAIVRKHLFMGKHRLALFNMLSLTPSHQATFEIVSPMSP